VIISETKIPSHRKMRGLTNLIFIFPDGDDVIKVACHDKLAQFHFFIQHICALKDKNDEISAHTLKSFGLDYRQQLFNKMKASDHTLRY